MTAAKQRPSSFGVVRNVVAAEMAALCGLVALLWIFQPQSVASAFWGGMVFIVPNAYFTLYAFRYSGSRWTYTVVLSLVRGQMGKLLLVTVGFALAFRFVQPLHPGYLFGGYIFVLAVHIAVAAKISERFGRVDASSGHDIQK